MKKCMASELHKIAMHGKAQTFARMFNCKKKLNASMMRIKDMPPKLLQKFHECTLDMQYSQSCNSHCDDEIHLPRYWKKSHLWTKRRNQCIQGCVDHIKSDKKAIEEAERLEKE